VVVVEPGSIDTEIWGRARRQPTSGSRAPARREAALRQAARSVSRAHRGDREPGISADKVAKVIYKAISADDPRHRYLVGIDAKVGARLKGNLPDRTFQRVIGRRLKMPTDVPEK
jgi:NAD(P)-dependent dehydrogenase (short-subunit alcohol dehydrogenase family)